VVKAKKEAVNKSQAIRDALAANPDKSPAEIAEELKAKGLDVNAQYVSTIKSNAKAKGRKRKLVRLRKPGGREATNGLGPVGGCAGFYPGSGRFGAGQTRASDG